MTKATNDATLNQAGTIYQYFIALRDCFELQDDDVLEIETHGDVSVISSNEGSSFQKEVKHHFGKSSLGERSIDFWKTLLIGILNMIELNVFLAVFFLLHLK